MKDYGIRKNASNYYDETAYKALSSVPRPGEIWTHKTHTDYVLILASNDRVSAMLKLDDKPREGKIEVLAKVRMYTDPIKLCYSFHDMLGSYVRTMSDGDFNEVRKVVARTLGLTKEIDFYD